jgi:hypothetical protein
MDRYDRVLNSIDSLPEPKGTEETGAERVGKDDIVLVQALVSIEKMGPFFQQERCFFLLTSPLMGDPSGFLCRSVNLSFYRLDIFPIIRIVRGMPQVIVPL